MFSEFFGILSVRDFEIRDFVGDPEKMLEYKQFQGIYGRPLKLNTH
jgi:hypothetical protein